MPREKEEQFTQVDSEAITAEYTIEDTERIHERTEREKTIQCLTPEYDLIVISKGQTTQGKYNNSMNRVREKLMGANRLTLGDLHASALKLLEFLILTGLATMPSDQAEVFKKCYTELIRAFKTGAYFNQEYQWHFTDQESEKYIRDLYQKLTEAIDTVEWIGNEKEAFLLGDAIGDRGLSDGLVLRIFRRIEESIVQKGNNTGIVTLASNHDLTVMIEHFLHSQDYSPLDGRLVNPAFTVSYSRARQLEEKEHLTQMYKDHFEDLQLLIAPGKTLYAHGAVERDHIFKILNQHQRQPILKTEFYSPHFFSKESSDFYQYLWKNVENNRPLDEYLDKMLVLLEFVWASKGNYTYRTLPFPFQIDTLVHGHSRYHMNERKMEIPFYLKKKYPYTIHNINQGCRQGGGSSDDDQEIIQDRLSERELDEKAANIIFIE